MKYPRCTLVSVITPGIYCVVSKEEEHVKEVKQMEKCLALEIKSAVLPDFSLKCQMCVAIKTSDGKIKRGVIEEILASGEYEVLLIDYGQVLIVDRSKIHTITNKAHLNVEPLSFIVKLFGIFPSKFGTMNGDRKASATQTWQPESEVFVKSLFEKSQDVIVQSILIKERTVYGDIFLETEPKQYKSLRKLLRKMEFCAYSKTNYIRQEGLDLPSNDLSELEAKMEFVKKWQRESFSNFQGFPFSVSPSFGSRSFLTESHVDKDNSRSETETTKALLGSSGQPGSGRGKIKLLLSQMRSLQATSSCNAKSSNTESSSIVQCAPGLTGKKEFLKPLEVKKKQSLKSESSFSKSNSKVEDDGEFDDADFPTVSQKVENAVVKPGECSIISDDNLTENSSEDSPPPLIRKNPVDIEFVERPKQMEKTEIKTNFKESKNSGSSLCEIKSFNLQKDENWALGKLKNDFVSHDVPLKLVLRNYWSPFVVFGDSVIEPANTFRELPIQPSIIWNLEKGGTFNELSQIQRWATPAIRKQHNTVVIGSSKTGKTLSYLVPLLDYVQDEFYFEELPDGNGPTVVIVASSSCVCESIYYMCNSLLGNALAENMYSSKIRIVLAHGNGCEKEVWVKLTNGCDILISTPHCLARLLEYPILTNFERLTCLVLDEVDVITQKYFKKQVLIVLEKAKLSTKKRYYQKIFCGEKWTPDVEKLVKKYAQTYALIIGSYLEAVIYERLKPSIYLVLHNRKAETLLEKLKDKIGKMKILVVCESASDAIFVDTLLTERKISSLVAHEKMMADKLKEIGNTWRGHPKFVLVLTDGVLSEMKIREAQVLVHYGLPVKSKTNFFLRYSAFENFIRETSRVQRNIQKKGHSSKLVDIIIVDEENHFQLPHIVDFVLRLGGKVSDKVRQKCEEIRRFIELSKADAPVCNNLLTFGRCRDSKSCSQRHAFIKSSDSPRRLPTSGWVNFTVIKVHSASLMSVRLFEHVDANKKVSKLDDRFLEIPVKLAEVFRAEDNRRPHGTPSLGDICAIKSEVLGQEVFYRAQVVEYLKLDRHEMPINVSLKLLDQGDIWNRKNIELYELPKELADYPPVAVDVRVTGIQPLDFDVSWSQIANAYVKDVMTQTLEDNQYWSGKIVLALNGVLFLDTIKRKQFLPHLNTHVFDLVLQEHLINNRFAVRNEEHIPSLIKLCMEGEIQVPKKEEVRREDTAKIQPQWAFFDSDFVEVKFLAASHTSSVFLQPKKFEKLLDELEEDCQSEGNRLKTQLPRKSKKSPVFSLTVGAFCLAKFEDGKWNRGRIDNETNNSFYIFFVDHGDFLSVPKIDVIPISQSLLLRLPCQAIECSLIGVDPKTECPIELLQEIYEFSDDGKLYLFALIIEKTKSELTCGRKYCLNLVNRKGVSLNKSLVLSGKVFVEESERKYLEDIEIALEDEEEALDNEFEQEIVEIPVTNYFEDLGDDVFTNEEGRAFLNEFSSKCLLKNKIPPQNQLAITDSSANVEMSLKPHIATGSTDSAKPEIVNQNVQKLLPEERLHQKKNLTLIKHDKVLTPQVLWSQNHLEIQIKIIVQNVQDFALECTVTNMAFRCFVGEKLYAFDLKLYGAINPQLTRLTLKAFHVIIILTKLVYPLWPRLHRDEGKHRLVNLDVESLTDKDYSCSDRIKSVKRDMKAGILKEGVKNVKIRPCSDSEDAEHELESESESE